MCKSFPSLATDWEKAGLEEGEKKATSRPTILPFEQIHFKTWTNTFCNLDKYILQFEQIYFATGKAGLEEGEKKATSRPTILPFKQIHFKIWTNTFCNLDKYKLLYVYSISSVAASFDLLMDQMYPPIHISAQNISKTFQSYF